MARYVDVGQDKVKFLIFRQIPNLPTMDTRPDLAGLFRPPLRCHSAPHSVFWGSIFIFSAIFSFLVFFYAAVLSKLLPPSRIPIFVAIRNDWYYCLLIPLTVPVVIIAVYLHWLSMKLFKHA